MSNAKICFEVEQLALILVEDVRVGGVERLGDVLGTGLDGDVFHHDVKLVVQVMFSITEASVMI